MLFDWRLFEREWFSAEVWNQKMVVWQLFVRSEFQASGVWYWNDLLTKGFCADSWDNKEFFITRSERMRWLINVEPRWKMWWNWRESICSWILWPLCLSVSVSVCPTLFYFKDFHVKWNFIRKWLHVCFSLNITYPEHASHLESSCTVARHFCCCS